MGPDIDKEAKVICVLVSGRFRQEYIQFIDYFKGLGYVVKVFVTMYGADIGVLKLLEDAGYETYLCHNSPLPGIGNIRVAGPLKFLEECKGAGIVLV